MTIDVVQELDKLHEQKVKLSLQTTATINMAQETIARSLKLSREVKKITGGQRD